MKLLIDIGNTNTSFAVVKENSIRRKYFIHTGRRQIEPASLKRLFGADQRKIEEIIIVSVVPKFLSLITRNMKTICPGAVIRLVGRDIKVPIKNKYRKPREVGQDRLVTAFAAARLFGCPVLVMDFGTGVTFDLVNRAGEYEGGLIFPGIALALGALTENTALLPEIELKPTKGLLGRDTRGSMNKGIIYGYAALCDGIIQRFREEYGKNLKTVATGGNAGLIAKHSNCIKTVYPDLILTGMLSL